MNIVSFGAWPSPVDAASAVAGAVGVSQVAIDGGDVWWVEARPGEGGRNALVRRDAAGQVADALPATFNVRSRVHEYGGGAYCVWRGTVWFSHDGDRRVHCCTPSGTVAAVSPDSSSLRFADLVADPTHRRVLCVCEDHTTQGREPANRLVALDMEGRAPMRVLAQGRDFYSSPCPSADGRRLAWLCWDHPAMPWDGCELWCVDLDADGMPAGEPVRVAGGTDESLFQPAWSPDGVLHFVSDRSGWWNLYRWRRGSVEDVVRMDADMGRPQWVFGMSTYAFENAQRVVCCYARSGMWQLARIDTARPGVVEDIPSPYSEFAYLRAAPGFAVMCAGGPRDGETVVRLDCASGRFDELRPGSAGTQVPDPSIAESIFFPTADGSTGHAFYYAPSGGHYRGPARERPPLVVMSHGGPTSAASSVLNPAVQFWTSRGIAVVDVNYGGSTGFGRTYRRRLDGAWGVVDVDDCIRAARLLVDAGRVDGQRLAIRGRSAGGFTTLAALVASDLFRSGASYYGVSDLVALAQDTHKFEARYLDRLVGPYPASAGLYAERSPINAVDRLSAPVIFFQGTEDRVVPPDQTERMAAALRAKGIAVACLLFPGEQHGFRQAVNIRRALEAELYFYGRVLGFTPADAIEPVAIENLRA